MGFCFSGTWVVWVGPVLAAVEGKGGPISLSPYGCLYRIGENVGNSQGASGFRRQARIHVGPQRDRQQPTQDTQESHRQGGMEMREQRPQRKL